MRRGAAVEAWAAWGNPFNSLDHLVGEQKERFRDREPKCFRGLEVHDQLKLRRLLHGQVGWPRASQILST
jgi:hypothetical protein